MSDLRMAVRRTLDLVNGEWAAALAQISAWARPRLHSADRVAFVRDIEEDVGPFAGPTLRSLVVAALDATSDTRTALALVRALINPFENPTIAADVDRERRNPDGLRCLSAGSCGGRGVEATAAARAGLLDGPRR